MVMSPLGDIKINPWLPKKILAEMREIMYGTDAKVFSAKILNGGLAGTHVELAKEDIEKGYYRPDNYHEDLIIMYETDDKCLYLVREEYWHRRVDWDNS